MTVALIFLGAYSAFLLTKVSLALLVLKRQRIVATELSLEQRNEISIAQPILSGDPELPRVLRRQLEALPREIAFDWMIDETDSEGRRIANEIAPSFPNVTIDVCPECAADVNPKTFKLARALERAERRFFVVLDDDTEIDEGALSIALDALDRSQLYTGLPMYRVPDGWWGGLLAHFVNSQSILTYLPPLVFFRPMSLNGMFYVVEAEALRSIGGFDSIRHELCDDYALHRHVTANGWTVTQGTTVQSVSTSIGSFSNYWRMMHRWMVFGALLARDQTLLRQAYLVTMLALPPILLLLAFPLAMLHWFSAMVFFLVTLGRHLALLGLHRAAGIPRIKFGFFRSLISELLQPFQMLAALLNSSIVWRGRRIRILDGLRFEISEAQ